MAPFNLRTFDRSTDAKHTGQIEIVERLVPVAEVYLGASGKEREAAGLLIARLLTRKDVNETYIPKFFSRLIQTWNSPTCTINIRVGLLTCLCETFKIGNRDILLHHVELGLSTIREMDKAPELQSNTLLRKLRIKLAQRLALTLLRPNRADWRYTNDPKAIGVPDGVATVVEDITNPPEVVEEIIGMLLESLRDKDTVVRYSSAKGIGRVTSRLPKSFAEEIVTAIKDSLEFDTRIISGKRRLKDSTRDSDWHGASLAIAELCRNGAIMPSALRELLPLVFLAVQFDIKKGSHSIGTSVRDAACYVMWSILRCYRTPVLTSFATQIASTLIVVAMFDREISVRRAASAAYQEGVGRHPEGVFPHGIFVLSQADFFAVGQRRASFLEVAPNIYQLSEYQAPILEYLVDTSCLHWDREVRELAGQCLGKLVSLSEASSVAKSSQSVQSLLLKLINHRESIDVNARHGSFYAIGEISSTLVRDSLEGPCLDMILAFGRDIPQYNFRGPQAALMYSACCHYIAQTCHLMACRAAVTAFEVSTAESIEHNAVIEHIEIAIGAFSLADPPLRNCAAEALAELSLHEGVSDIIQATSSSASETSNLKNPSVLKGWLTFFGLLDYSENSSLFNTAIDTILDSATITGDRTRDDPETRKIAITSLGRLMSQFLLLKKTSPDAVKRNLENLVETLNAALLDYTVDARGDVGSWVREAAVTSSCHFMNADESYSFMTQDISESNLRLFENTISQCLSKIDNFRVTSTQLLTKALEVRLETATATHGNGISPVLADSLPVLTTANEALSNGDPSVTLFQNLTPLMNITKIRRTILTEYLICATSGSQSTMTSASAALASFLELQTAHAIDNILSDVEVLIRTYKTDDRVLIPVISSTADMLDAQLLSSTNYDFGLIFNAVQDSTINTRTMSKIMASARCYAALAGLDSQVKYKAWKKLSLSLGHRYPNIRVMAAELLYGILSNLDLETTAEAEPVVEVLINNDWTQEPQKYKIELVKAFMLP